MERVRFLSISQNNLDEFYMVRVAGLAALVRKGVDSLSADGMTPIEQLMAVNEASSELQDEQQIIWRNLQEELVAEGIHVVQVSDLTDADFLFLRKKFLEEMWPQLTPQSVDPGEG